MEMKPLIFGDGPVVGTIPCRQEDGRTRGYEASFGGARSAGLVSSAQGKFGLVSYDSLLLQLRHRRDRVSSSSMSSEVAISSIRTY